MSIEPRYWFPAKRCGWGWGLPQTWQGWVVVALWFVVFFGGIFAIGPRSSPTALVLWVTGMTLALVCICWLKGEPPRWRWGDD